MNNRLFATLAVALALSIVEVRATDGQAPPAQIRIGSDQDMFEGAVHNVNHAFGTIFKFTNVTNGPINSLPTAIGLASGFSSFAAYTDYVISNNYYFFLRWKPLMDPTKELKLVTYVGYAFETGGSVDSLESRTTVGLVSLITSNSFVAAFQPTNLYVIIPTPGLQEYTIEVPGVYTNSWPTVAGRPVQYPPPALNLVTFPPELTTNNVVVINSFWGRHQFDLRISIKAGNKRSYYTQFGDQLGTPPGLTMTRSYIATQFPRGSRVSILSSTDLQNWSAATNFSDLSGIGQFLLQYSTNLPRLFYRVGVR